MNSIVHNKYFTKRRVIRKTLEYNPYWGQEFGITVSDFVERVSPGWSVEDYWERKYYSDYAGEEVVGFIDLARVTILLYEQYNIGLSRRAKLIDSWFEDEWK